MNPEEIEDMSDDELSEKHDQLLRIQKGELDAGYSVIAHDIAQVRDHLWREAQNRGFSL